MRKMFNFLSLTLSLFCAFSVFAEDSAQPKFPKQVLNLSADERVRTNALLADKNDRQLNVVDLPSLNEGKSLETYNIDIGKKSGDKKKRNDKRTPEGIYVFLEKKTQPEIPYDLYGSMAFTTNYPNYFDKHENKTGDGIWLHSVPDDVPLTRGSRGCVVLRNDDIKKIQSNIKTMKTVIIIDRKIDWIDLNSHTELKKQALNWLEKWRNDWETQNIESYIEHYAEDFKSPPFNKKTWYRHKKNLKEKYSFVNVQLSEPNVFQVKNQYVFQFVQTYKSDGHEDIGIKTLYVLKKGNSMQIAREEWAALRN